MFQSQLIGTAIKVIAPTTDHTLHDQPVPDTVATYRYTWDRRGVRFAIQLVSHEFYNGRGEIRILDDQSIEFALSSKTFDPLETDRLIDALTIAQQLQHRLQGWVTEDQNTPLQKVIANIAQNMAEGDPFGASDFLTASNHPRSCKCNLCLQWLVQMGPDYDGEQWIFYPFTQEEFIKGGGVVPVEPPDEEV